MATAKGELPRHRDRARDDGESEVVEAPEETDRQQLALLGEEQHARPIGPRQRRGGGSGPWTRDQLMVAMRRHGVRLIRVGFQRELVDMWTVLTVLIVMFVDINDLSGCCTTELVFSRGDTSPVDPAPLLITVTLRSALLLLVDFGVGAHNRIRTEAQHKTARVLLVTAGVSQVQSRNQFPPFAIDAEAWLREHFWFFLTLQCAAVAQALMYLALQPIFVPNDHAYCGDLC